MLFRFFITALASLFSNLAMAGGPYDGIYNLPNTPEYLSVHQNGTRLIVGWFSTIPATGISFNLGSGQNLPPNRMDIWDLFSGVISGNSARLTGEVAYGSCNSTLDAAFTASSVTITQKFINTTSLGNYFGIDCPSYQQFLVDTKGLSQNWVKAF